MEYIPFDRREFEVKEMHYCGPSMNFKARWPDFPIEEPIYNRPISEKENFRAWFRGEKTLWRPAGGWYGCDMNVFRPRMNPDNVVAHCICDAERDYQYENNVMRSSWYDLDWVYVPVAGGSTVMPGNPKIEDMKDWKELVKIPDLDELDWEGCAEKNREYLDTPLFNQLGILSGLWERLISLMDVSGAAIALVDEDQKEYVKEFFEAHTEMLIEYIRRMKEICDIDGVLIHDDWGTQRAGFFSLDTAMEMLVPYLKKITDAVHDMGMYFELHSCGKTQDLVPAYIAAGVDQWNPQAMNDLLMLAETYKDQPITFGMQEIDIQPDATEEEQAEAATKWYDTYKDYRVIPAFFRSATPVIRNTIYELSRIDSEKQFKK